MPPSFPDLERRFFQKGVPWAERERILDAALNSRVGRGAFSPEAPAVDRFIDAARVVLCRPDLVEPPLVGYGSELPLALRVPIASMILQRMPLTHEWLFAWWSCAGRTGGGASDLSGDEAFRTLFALGFARRYPRGMPLGAPTRRLAPIYRSASGTFEAPVDLAPYGGPLLDISDLREPLARAGEIAAEAARALEPLNALPGRAPERRDPAEAPALRPAEPRRSVPSRARVPENEPVPESAPAPRRAAPPPLRPPLPGLDPEKLRRIHEETARAQQTLGGVLGAAGETLPRAAPAPPPIGTGPDIREPPSPPPPRFPGLDAGAARLAEELIGRAHWSELEFEALARRHRVMPEGVVEILNDWSTGLFQEPMVEVYEGYDLSPSVTAKLSSEA